jgi:hypothetical protein
MNQSPYQAPPPYRPIPNKGVNQGAKIAGMGIGVFFMVMAAVVIPPLLCCIGLTFTGIIGIATAPSTPSTSTGVATADPTPKSATS